MKKLVLIAIMVLIVVVNKVFACSVHVNDLYEKNLLAAHGANHLALDLASVRSHQPPDYAQACEGADAYECPLYLCTSAKVIFAYSPSKFQHCNASVVVTRRQYMGSELPD